MAVSTNGGANFIDVWAESGSSGGTQWVQIGDNTSFPNLDGHASLYFRWRLVSNASVTADGAVRRSSGGALQAAHLHPKLCVHNQVRYIDGEPARGGRCGAGLRRRSRVRRVLGVKDAILNGVDKKASLSGARRDGRAPEPRRHADAPGLLPRAAARSEPDFGVARARVQPMHVAEPPPRSARPAGRRRTRTGRAHHRFSGRRR